MNTHLEQCGLRFTTVRCAEAKCKTEFDVDADHPRWPDGPYYCRKHERKRKRPRKFKVRVP